MDLLVPIKIELPTNDYLILKQHLDVLDTIGITYEEFGFNTLLIRSTPVWFKKRRRGSIRSYGHRHDYRDEDV